MICPKAKDKNCKHKLEELLPALSFVCYKAKCNDNKDLEFYRVTGGLLLTRDEFFERKKAEGEL